MAARGSSTVLVCSVLSVAALVSVGCPPKTGPTAAFKGEPTSGPAPLTVQFTDHSASGSSSIQIRHWDFGDGATSTQKNPVHTYTNPGAFDVSLTVSTNVGSDTQTETQYITVAEGGEGEGEGERNYRQDMRDFVQAISVYAKAQHPGFLCIPQNGEPLLTLDELSDGAPCVDYISAIDGQGREDLFYGYNADNLPTPAGERDRILGFLDLAENEGVEVLVTDYCSTHAYMDDSYASNAAHGFISFAANHRDLDNIPNYPAHPHNENAADVSTLGDARSFLYLIDPGAFASRTDFLGAVEATNHDLLILDLFFEDAALTAAEVTALKNKANGGARLVIAYMSIGEAEDYRYYWQSGWQPGSPSWIEAENPDWEGNYKVRYWDPGWQAIIFGNPGAYLDRILAAGFSGVYLDIIDAYEYFEGQ